ncbi:MAG TPA: nuclear transport factor 2 family protein [Gammaproteobacteria bacterium]|nr:nuclear transport factor 2 family protein [Gammaproteobacteria bacterium]
MAAALTALERLEIRAALEDLNAAFTYCLDHDDIDGLVALFTEDALYTHGPRRSEGRAEIEALFRGRAAAGPRTARHLYSGLRLEIESRTHATGTSVCMTFAQNGVPPIEPAVPILVADFNDAYARGDDGRWRIRERHIVRIFVDRAETKPVGYRG